MAAAATPGAADSANALTLRWAFGFNRDVGVHNLCDENRAALFYGAPRRAAPPPRARAAAARSPPPRAAQRRRTRA